MSDSDSIDERSRLLPAIPHRSYVYADELVIAEDKEMTNCSQADSLILILEPHPRTSDDELQYE